MSKQFCNEDSIPSIDSDDFIEILSSSSFDRSSVGSIPWAEDAIKQNQQEWERIERLFYGEEDLSQDQQEIDLKNEIIEWRKAFPHLRINGTKLKLYKFKSLHPLPLYHKNYEELFAVHSNSSNNNRNINIAEEENSKKEKIDLIRDDETIATKLENNLRISSVRRLRHNSNKSQNQDLTLLSASSQGKSFIFPNYKSSKKFLMKPSNSATIIRVPSIITTVNPQRNYLTHPLLHKTSNEQPKSGRSVTLRLPLIIDRGSGDSHKNRSISAAVTHRTLSDFSLLNSASKQI